jgi:4,5-DOPA dioxygenase extradiol
LVISAHWYVPQTAITAMPAPRTIHDFYGFPPELFAVRYPAPGDPALAAEIASLCAPVSVALDQSEWGLDHGTWSVLVHAFPKADVPVLQIAIDAREDMAFHFELGARLLPLRAQGVLIVGSGNVVHNLRAIDWSRPDGAFDWAERFDEAARQILVERPHDVLTLAEHPDFARAVPTAEHFLPLVYFAGLASAAGRGADVEIDGYAYGSLSMTSYSIDAASKHARTDLGAGAGLPDPRIIRPEDTNT